MFLFFIEMCGIRSGHLFTIEAENPRGADYLIQKGSGCGSVGRAGASDSICLQFDSSHRKNLY